MKEQKISAIREGTVIDHIPTEYTFKVAEILDVRQFTKVISIASNLQSKKHTKKGIIKIGGYFLEEKDVQKIALIAPNATLSVIKNFKVESKKRLQIPKEIHNIIRCFNPNCITNHEKVNTCFFVESSAPLHVRCYHCERMMTKKDIQLI